MTTSMKNKLETKLLQEQNIANVYILGVARMDFKIFDKH